MEPTARIPTEQSRAPKTRTTSAEAWLHDPDVNEARAVLRGEVGLPSPEELQALAARLRKKTYFSYARRLLARARACEGVAPGLRLQLCQQQALATYKDANLPLATRLDGALAILRADGELATTRDQETLGLAGAIYKRRWEAAGQKADLEHALAYYRRGAAEGAALDDGYTAINAAFVLDLLAAEEEDQAEKAGTVSETADVRRREAAAIRQEIVRELGPRYEEDELPWWFLVTVAEAYFGLREYDEAQRWLQRARALPDTADWEYQTTALQFAALARLQEEDDLLEEPPGEGAGPPGPSAREVLHAFLGEDEEAVRSSVVGKVGLALSGGGFRASLFHIGVLAKLAERDVLRRVEVLSCVSGGSIIGAYYYLEVRKLLHERRDDEVTREDYIAIVRRIERQFLEGVQTNIRTRVLAEWWTSVKMAFFPNYSRTQRLGELYEKHLFARVADGEGEDERWLSDLFVQPKGGPPKFNPKTDNWRRRAKVPVLILNATALNTGHNWQFTASWMGESPFRIDPDIDSNEVLRRMYYAEAPPKYQRVRLGHAVAASSCVPGLFEPLALPDLYPEHTVRLVDGGVHDNQGEAGLLEQDCTVLLVSDASGQMAAEPDPKRGLLGVISRTNGILMARVREAQHQEMAARERGGLLRGLMFVHLKKDLGAGPVDWDGCLDPPDPTTWGHAPDGTHTDYGVPKGVQERLATIRTDLDSFTDAEAYALMLSGYRMVEHDAPRCLEGLPQHPGGDVTWEFMDVEPAFDPAASGHERLLQLLAAARSRAFKIWALSRPLRWTSAVLAVAALVGLVWVVLEGIREPAFAITPAGVALTVLTTVAATLFGKTVVRLVRYRTTLMQVGVGLGMLTLGWLVARLHLHVFDRLYLRWGALRRFVPQRETPPSHAPPSPVHHPTAGAASEAPRLTATLAPR